VSDRTFEAWLEAFRAGETRALARALTWAEDGDERAARLLAAVARGGRRAQVVGITGSPGVGKSTLVDRLVRALRAQGREVGVLAVDPSSPFSGGAVLGDRVRMTEGTADPGVFVRSLATRGRLGGLSAATGDAIRLFDAFGKDVVLVETVGAGQAEVDIMALADTVVVVLAPGLGDDVQAIKAGILEIADVLVVNKGDRPGADLTVRELRQMLLFGRRAGSAATGDVPEWLPPVLRATALSGEGVADVVRAIGDHALALARTGAAVGRRRRAAERALSDALSRLLLTEARAAVGDAWDEAVGRIAAGEADAPAAAAALARRLSAGADVQS
jgi:LAO/AO transport system kinase